MQLFPSHYDDPLSELFYARLPAGEPWGWLLCQRILGDETLARHLLGEPLSPGLAQWIVQELLRLRQELKRLQQQHPFADFGSREATKAEQTALIVLQTGSPASLASLYQTYGYGIYAYHTVFRYSQQMQAVEKPDPVSFDDLVGYTRQIQTVCASVERFLAGKPATAMLLYGARGTGKSSTVKALRTRYAGQGLRLVELLADGLEQLPELLELLAPLPFRFVLYLDDLALFSDDERFHKLKALLEGAVFERPRNVLLIATSNRRNLVAQHWSDRPEPGTADPASWDTMQDKLGLADRFGLVLTFPPFDQEQYLQAVAQMLGRELDETIRNAALQFALDGRGFSGRTARHFAVSSG
jgi:predicted AAA+ superfamily ATPase